MAKEKKELKALQVAEEKEYQRKLQEKVDRDNEELQWQYDQEREMTNTTKKSHKEQIAERTITTYVEERKFRSKTPGVTIFTYVVLTYSQYYSHRTTTKKKKKKKIQIN